MRACHVNYYIINILNLARFLFHGFLTFFAVKNDQLGGDTFFAEKSRFYDFGDKKT